MSRTALRATFSVLRGLRDWYGGSDLGTDGAGQISVAHHNESAAGGPRPESLALMEDAAADAPQENRFIRLDFPTAGAASSQIHMPPIRFDSHGPQGFG
jgi:hypothetical protein